MAISNERFEEMKFALANEWFHHYAGDGGKKLRAELKMSIEEIHAMYHLVMRSIDTITLIRRK